MCGENGAYAVHAPEFAGSSPRVRGKLGSSVSEAMSVGLIPACAGKTGGYFVAVDAGGAHPRVCGENVKLPASKSRISGSSPRVRGKPMWASGFMRVRRLIPACAGKTD